MGKWEIVIGNPIKNVIRMHVIVQIVPREPLSDLDQGWRFQRRCEQEMHGMRCIIIVDYSSESADVRWL